VKYKTLSNILFKVPFVDMGGGNATVH